jgi:zinc transporter, ZIP family
VIGVLSGMPPVLQALVATTFTWGVTALGAALVFGTKQVVPSCSAPRLTLP